MKNFKLHYTHLCYGIIANIYENNIDDWMVGNYNEEIINNLEKNVLEKIN